MIAAFEAAERISLNPFIQTNAEWLITLVPNTRVWGKPLGNQFSWLWRYYLRTPLFHLNHRYGLDTTHQCQAITYRELFSWQE